LTVILKRKFNSGKYRFETKFSILRENQKNSFLSANRSSTKNRSGFLRSIEWILQM